MKTRNAPEISKKIYYNSEPSVYSFISDELTVEYTCKRYDAMYIGTDFLIDEGLNLYLSEVNTGLPAGAQEYDLVYKAKYGKSSGIFQMRALKPEKLIKNPGRQISFIREMFLMIYIMMSMRKQLQKTNLSFLKDCTRRSKEYQLR